MACAEANGPHNMLQISKDGLVLTVQDCRNLHCLPAIERFFATRLTAAA